MVRRRSSLVPTPTADTVGRTPAHDRGITDGQRLLGVPPPGTPNSALAANRPSRQPPPRFAHVPSGSGRQRRHGCPFPGLVGSVMPVLGRRFLPALLLTLLAVLVPNAIERAEAGGLNPSPDRAPPTVTTAPDFAGTAHPIAPASACPAVLPGNLVAPFGPNTPTSGHYRIAGCWEGQLAGTPFTIDLYFSSCCGGGVAVRSGGRLTAHVLAGAGPPGVVRFTGEDACWVEQAGAFYGAVNIRTGAVMPEDEARRVCPPPPNSAAIAGLQPGQSLVTTPAASGQPPSALPRTGGGGTAIASWVVAPLVVALGALAALCCRDVYRQAGAGAEQAKRNGPPGRP